MPTPNFRSQQQIDGDAPTVVAGAGLAGCVISLLLAQRGHRVLVFERRPDPRTYGFAGGRSINLALSARGLRALRLAGIEEDVVRTCIPMYGRILHDQHGGVVRQPYGPRREHILSVSRAVLNRLLLDAADAFDNVEFRFDSPVEDVDLVHNAIQYRSAETNRLRTQRASLIVAADGAFSAVREACRKTPGFNYSQQFLGHGYKELVVPAGADGSHQLATDGLHIWPRHEFMLIALPNPDGTFTATLFLPMVGAEASFATLRNEAAIEAFFSEHFPDAAPLIPDLATQFFTHPTGTMVTVDCEPQHFGQGVVLLGDAAHAMVPFYGQGMNAAFEDCAELVELLERSESQKLALRAYTCERLPNTRAISQLALANFHEMQSDVARPIFRLRKRAERALERWFPAYFRSLYSMVSFSNIPYADAVRRSQRQTRLLEAAAAGAAALGLAALGRGTQRSR